MSFLTENLKVFPRIKAGKCVHILALGASCTEHFMVGTHWFDIVEIGFMHTFRRWTDDRKSVYTTQLCLNAATSNHTTNELLARFDRDVAPFQPDLVIQTCGFNDANPDRNVSLEEFKSNLKALREKVERLGGDVLFQTPYEPDIDRWKTDHPEWAANIPSYVQALREVAGPFLSDNYPRWQLLRRHAPAVYRLMMRDALHLNPNGNALLGLDIARKLELTIPEENEPWMPCPLAAQKCMDMLEEQFLSK